jgi:hypothetical protein
VGARGVMIFIMALDGTAEHDLIILMMMTMIRRDSSAEW